PTGGDSRGARSGLPARTCVCSWLRIGEGKEPISHQPTSLRTSGVSLKRARESNPDRDRVSHGAHHPAEGCNPPLRIDCGILSTLQELMILHRERPDAQAGNVQISTDIEMVRSCPARDVELDLITGHEDR